MRHPQGTYVVKSFLPFHISPIRSTMSVMEEAPVQGLHTNVQPVVVPRYFVLRRIHSLTGIIPLGIFVVFHLAVSAVAVGGKAHYDSILASIYRSPAVIVFQVVVILIPLAFHGLYGVVLAFRTRSNPFTYPFIDNWRYAAQRLSGIILLLCMVPHLKLIWFPVIRSSFGGSFSTFDITKNVIQDPSNMVILTITVAMASFHLANGIWTWLQRWGMVVTDRGRIVSGVLLSIFFVVLMIVGNWTIQVFYP
jgi:succinate dehydrogenase / fumarate reductase cytochrome b subunit